MMDLKPRKLYNDFRLSSSKPTVVPKHDIVLRRECGIACANVPWRLCYHSPDGFEWGYAGSGPADLALNILAMFTDEKTAFSLHQKFKDDFLVNVPRHGRIIENAAIVYWLKENDNENR